MIIVHIIFIAANFHTGFHKCHGPNERETISNLLIAQCSRNNVLNVSCVRRLEFRLGLDNAIYPFKTALCSTLIKSYRPRVELIIATQVTLNMPLISHKFLDFLLIILMSVVLCYFYKDCVITVVQLRHK